MFLVEIHINLQTLEMKEKKNLVTAVVLMLMIFILGACTHTPVVPANPAVSYSKQVQPVLVANCTMSGCHSTATGGYGEEAFSLMTYSDLIQKNMIVPGNAKSSRLYTAINGTGENSMPPNGALSNDDILLIYLWIEQGAKNN
jgi:hypothetical protein